MRRNKLVRVSIQTGVDWDTSLLIIVISAVTVRLAYPNWSGLRQLINFPKTVSLFVRLAYPNWSGLRRINLLYFIMSNWCQTGISKLEWIATFCAIPFKVVISMSDWHIQTGVDCDSSAKSDCALLIVRLAYPNWSGLRLSAVLFWQA